MPGKSYPQILFIINPKAGKRKIRKLVQELELQKPKVDFVISKHPGHGYEIVRDNLSRYRYFVAAGGDGTVNEIASALIDTDRVLAVLPYGSGNGFAREFGFGKDVSQLLAQIESGKFCKADVLYLNEKPCVHVAGSGFDSAVTRDFEKLKRHGFLNYGISILRILFTYRPAEATILLPTGSITGRFFMICLANTGQFGYNVHISKQSDPTDGKYELVLIESMSPSAFPLLAIKLLFGKQQSIKRMRTIVCKSEISISVTGNNFQIEGEPVQLQSPVKVKIAPASLKVLDVKKAGLNLTTFCASLNFRASPGQ